MFLCPKSRNCSKIKTTVKKSFKNYMYVKTPGYNLKVNSKVNSKVSMFQSLTQSLLDLDPSTGRFATVFPADKPSFCTAAIGNHWNKLNQIKSNMCLFGCKQFNYIIYTVKQYAQRLLTTRTTAKKTCDY